MQAASPLSTAALSQQAKARSSGGTRTRSSARVVDARVMVDEVVDLYVKATGKDGVQMRESLANMRLDDLRRSREEWRARAEETQRLQDKKEEVWENLFQRQPRLGPNQREEFEREYKQKVTTGPKYSPFGSCDTGGPCKRGWKTCSRQLWHKIERRKPEKYREWGRRMITPVAARHKNSMWKRRIIFTLVRAPAN